MSYAKRMLDTYPRDFNLDAGILAATIDALSDCAQACTACADDCLSEEMVAELTKCIRLNLDCDAAGGQPPDRLRRQRDPVRAPGMHPGLQELWGRVRTARPDARALPGLRRGLPPLRAGL
jgi:hypothetical protein